MDKITPSLEAATATTAKGTSIGYVSASVSGIITHMHCVRGASLFLPQSFWMLVGPSAPSHRDAWRIHSSDGWDGNECGPGQPWKKAMWGLRD